MTLNALFHPSVTYKFTEHSHWWLQVGFGNLAEGLTMPRLQRLCWEITEQQLIKQLKTKTKTHYLQKRNICSELISLAYRIPLIAQGPFFFLANMNINITFNLLWLFVRAKNNNKKILHYINVNEGGSLKALDVTSREFPHNRNLLQSRF